MRSRTRWCEEDKAKATAPRRRGRIRDSRRKRGKEGGRYELEGEIDSQTRETVEEGEGGMRVCSSNETW